jgi:hypothetical protein
LAGAGIRRLRSFVTLASRTPRSLVVDGAWCLCLVMAGVDMLLLVLIQLLWMMRLLPVLRLLLLVLTGLLASAKGDVLLCMQDMAAMIISSILTLVFTLVAVIWAELAWLVLRATLHRPRRGVLRLLGPSGAPGHGRGKVRLWMRTPTLAAARRLLQTLPARWRLLYGLAGGW